MCRPYECSDTCQILQVLDRRVRGIYFYEAAGRRIKAVEARDMGKYMAMGNGIRQSPKDHEPLLLATGLLWACFEDALTHGDPVVSCPNHAKCSNVWVGTASLVGRLCDAQAHIVLLAEHPANLTTYLLRNAGPHRFAGGTQCTLVGL